MRPAGKAAQESRQGTRRLDGRVGCMGAVVIAFVVFASPGKKIGESHAV
jgi:hypothetical protein